MSRHPHLARTAALLLVAFGVLLMHTDIGSAAAPSHSAATAMAMAVLPDTGLRAVGNPAAAGHSTEAQLSGPASTAPGSSPSACGGGPLCRAVLADSHELVIPAGAADVPPTDGAADPCLTRLPSRARSRPPPPPPSRELLQIWRC
jgi:hypothetical protein